MATVSPGLFTRHRFSLGDKSLLASLRLRVKYDDAYVAFVNGVEVARGNFTGERAYNVNMAAALQTAIPPLAIYFVLGKFFVQGIAAGAVKG